MFRLIFYLFWLFSVIPNSLFTPFGETLNSGLIPDSHAWQKQLRFLTLKQSVWDVMLENWWKVLVFLNRIHYCFWSVLSFTKKKNLMFYENVIYLSVILTVIKQVFCIIANCLVAYYCPINNLIYYACLSIAIVFIVPRSKEINF